MKIMKLFCLAGALAATVFAQGTISFTADMSGAQEIPPNGSLQKGRGLFVLTDDSFYGRVSVSFGLPVSSVSLFRSTTASDLGTKIYDFSPDGWVPPYGGGGGEDDYSLLATLTPSQKAELGSGLWWVNVSTPAYPNGEMRGQITAVPEPETWTLLGLGLCGIALGCKRVFSRKK